MKGPLAIFVALLQIISFFSVQDSNFKFDVDRFAAELVSTADFSFPSLTAEETAVTEQEKKLCLDWYKENIVAVDDGVPAYNFTVGGKQFRNNLEDWTVSVSEESAEGEVYAGGKTTYIIHEHKESNLVATVEATIYEENASCEWTVRIRNTGNENSPVIKNFLAADCEIPTGRNNKVYFSKGSDPAPDDFELLKSSVGYITSVFTANGGRTESFLPYFNFVGNESGVVLSVGWSGQWYASYSQGIGGVNIKAKQEKLKGYLTADEEIRSPMVALTFYDSDNALKGFNSFRNFTMDCIYPENTKQITTTGIAVETLESMFGTINITPEDWIPKLDYYWIDALWYPFDSNWSDGVGDWFPNPERFGEGDGFAQATEYALSKGMKTLLWYEPERCAEGTVIYNKCDENEGWLLKDEGERNVVNFANEDCLEYMTEFMLASLEELNIKCVRIDCNITLLSFWEDADKKWCDGRKGITENHYITNLYQFFDSLLAGIPDLRLDNCCSGGKRLDIEMSKRGIPLWRTDYNCMDGDGNSHEDILQATQAHTYGISFWLPYNGTCAYVEGEYADRTNILSCSQRLEYYEIRHYMTGNYYPLTYGGTDTEKYLAMQFDENAAEGMALIYKRENVESNVYRLVLNGLEPERTYELYDYDCPDKVLAFSGEQLMSEGVEIEINETPKAVIMLYRAK